MLPEFRSQLFQLPLIGTIWTCARNRYVFERKNSSFPIRFILSIIEQTITLVHGTVIQPLLVPSHSYVNSLDHFLSSRIGSLRQLCPIVDQTSDEIIERYGDLFFVSFFNKNFASTSTNDHSNNPETNNRREKSFQFLQRYLQFLTHILMIIEMYSKYVQKELNDHIDTTRNLWKNLNMEDGRSLDEVESFSEKLLVLGRRMTGNYRQFVYLIRYQFKRCRYVLCSFLRAQNRFRSTIWRITQKVQMNRMNQTYNDRARHGLVTSKERVRHYLEIMMLHAAKHPWMRWALPKNKELALPQKPLKSIRPIFFVSSNNNSDCSEPEDTRRDRCSKIFESTPYRKNHEGWNGMQSKEQMPDVLSNISTPPSPSRPEESFDVKEILRQVDFQSRPRSDSTDSNNQDDENQIIEQAFNESNDNEQQQQQQQEHPVSVFDLSPMLASGCAV